MTVGPRSLCATTLAVTVLTSVALARADDVLAETGVSTSGARVAVVLNEEIKAEDPAEMQQVVLSRLFERYAAERGIEITDAELDAYVDAMRRGMRAAGLTADEDLTPEEKSQADAMRREMGRAMIRQWKINRALHQEYGGRVIYQQLGPEPLDAYRKYLEERREAGDFVILRKDFADKFWRYFTDDSMHDFYQPGSEAEAAAFRVPPWSVSSAEQASTTAVDMGLAGTQWRFVRFQSMDDATGEIIPDDPSLYTMTLHADGSVEMVLHCNRATGTWSAQPASDGISGSFSFGALVTTKVLCPPPSMDERIARDAQWVRGFVLRDGQLHLSLMADGGIYSWEPAGEPGGSASSP